MKRFIDDISSMLWFLMDVCWMSDQDTLAAILIIPTIYSTMIMFWYADYHMTKVLVAIATNCWVLMNVCWMIPDITTAAWAPYVGWLKWVFMIIGFLSMVVILLTDYNGLRKLRRFR